MSLEQGLAMFCHTVETNELALPVLFGTINGKTAILVIGEGHPRDAIERLADEGVRFDEVIMGSEAWVTLVPLDAPNDSTRTEAVMILRVTRSGDFGSAVRPFVRRANGSVSWGEAEVDNTMSSSMADALRRLVS